ncbi:MAG: hypothetical protein ABSA45_11275 [Verrucomicrobiota bacterium]
MAGIVIHAEVLNQARVAGMFAAQTIKKPDSFATIFQQTERLRFEAEM